MRTLFGGDPLAAVELFPLSHPWAYAHLQQGKHNTWFPEEVPLGEDARDWERLTPEDRHAISLLLGFFNPMESLVTHNLILAIYPYVTAPEARLYLARQIWEEANHSLAFEYVLKTLPVDRKRIFSAHRDEPAIRAKEDFLQRLTEEILRSRPDLSTRAGRETLLENLVGYYIVLEGIFFYSGFLLALSFRRRNLLKGLASIIDWVIKDESLHLSFGLHLITGFLDEYPETLTPELGRELRGLILQAVELERRYSEALLPRPLLGVSAELVQAYVEYVADRRLEELGLGTEFGTPNPAKWLATELDLPEQVNFFEAINTGYEVAVPRG
ncbi:ribonucleotide-diphosphate reductase subunit beta [Thermomicrobiaceae bacterium CFH 74404]|uniref:Ribonucleoside-diphosphate reductase subunit beta n=1 Tax=Thermalbibacter longus TaxID=2951981 RepID=A0AA41WF15_9BACT|nr:ribonucleotide-diphosphate reductase subunit beta [Thermalbibacter longus]MCM8748903.1 ribonucleotide-diphosphate reductase subunit beta [Thermalbibacter longus]